MCTLPVLQVINSCSRILRLREFKSEFKSEFKLLEQGSRYLSVLALDAHTLLSGFCVTQN